MATDRAALTLLLLRWYLGFALFVPLGVGKLAGFPGSAAGLIDSHLETILGTVLMRPFLYVFAYALPFIETLGGLALLLGWQTRWTFLVLAGLLVLLGFGTTLDGRIATTANNLIFTAACLWGYERADADRYGITACWGSRG